MFWEHRHLWCVETQVADLDILTITCLIRECWPVGSGFWRNRLLVTLSGSRLYCVVENLYEILSWNTRRMRMRRREGGRDGEEEEEAAQS